MDTPEITSRLKAAEPTMVDAPSSPGHLFRPPIVSMQESKISGALEPRTIRVKLATVGFQKSMAVSISMKVPSYCYFFYLTITFFEVIFSMDSIKISETMEIPMNRYIKVRQYAIPNRPLGIMAVPGMITQLLHTSVFFE